MMTLTAFGLAIGALLGTKFRVWVLLPAMAVGSALISVAGMPPPIAETAGAIAAYGTALQLGYLVAASARHILISGQMTQLTDEGLQRNRTLPPPRV
jgi:hypothetical protein